MRKTSIIEKILPSAINAAVVIAFSLPILYYSSLTVWKISTILLFFIYNLLFLIFNKNRCLGMILCGTNWSRKNAPHHEYLYIILYTLSFSTLFVWVWFPFDIFLANIFLLQLPAVLLTSTTFHGFLAGNKYTVIKSKIKKRCSLTA